MATLVPLPVRSRSRKVRTATRSWMMLPFTRKTADFPNLPCLPTMRPFKRRYRRVCLWSRTIRTRSIRAQRLRLPVPEASEVIKLAIYNITGQLVRTLHSDVIAAGQHSVVWDGTDFREAKVASGAYVYQLEAKGFVISRKLTQMK